MSFCFFQKPQEVPLSKWFCSKNWLPQHGCSATDISKLSFRLFENMVPHGTPKIQCLKNHGVSIDDFMFFLGHLIGRCSRLQVFGVLPTEGGWKERCHSKILTVWGPFEISHRGGNLGPSRCFASALRISGRWGWSKVKQWGSKRIIS